MPLNSLDKELIDSNLLGATNLKELHSKEKLLTNTKMLSLPEPLQKYFFIEHLLAVTFFDIF